MLVVVHEVIQIGIIPQLVIPPLFFLSLMSFTALAWWLHDRDVEPAQEAGEGYLINQAPTQRSSETRSHWLRSSQEFTGVLIRPGLVL